MKSNIKDIGKALVEQAENKPSSARGMVDELFPYIYAASKRMSARAISKWLEEKQQVKLSYTTVSKVLKEADERMLKHFRNMREIEDQIHGTMPLASPQAAQGDKTLTLLFDEDAFERMVNMGMGLTNAILSDEFKIPEASRTKAINTIRNEWFELPEVYRNDCKSVVLSENEKQPAENSQKEQTE